MIAKFGFLAAMVALGFGWTMPAQAQHAGPHKGMIVEWGDEEYHVEVVVDRKTGEVTAYLYGDDESLKEGKAKAIAAKVLTLSLKTTDPATTVKLEAKPIKGDAEGSASVFIGKSDAFKTEAKLSGIVSGKIGTKPYSGEFVQKK